MVELEGVIKYRLDFVESEPTVDNLQNLNCWRSILYGLGLIGQDVLRYEGYGFGNLSQRSQLDKSRFIISATQTGKVSELTHSHYVCVEHCDIAENHVVARGPLKPSSEALTHAMFYQLDTSVECVIHVHSQKLWRFGLEHDYPCSATSVEYGTQDMAEEIFRLYQSESLQQRKTLVMGGHEDGVICFGGSVDQAAMALVALWMSASPGRATC